MVSTSKDTSDHISPIDVILVEAHHHCLEHIHAILRRDKIFRPWSMLHFDAHPDLACPTVPAMACFTPRQHQLVDDVDGKNLYELMDGTASGIAEWILPLVLAAQLTTVEWVKPSFARQLPLGRHRFRVGVQDPDTNKAIDSFMDLSSNARLKVDWNHAYYWDDHAVVPADDLVLAQSCQLQVTELDVQSTNKKVAFVSLLQEMGGTTNSDCPWMLDLCLDYFCCRNPYLSDVDALNPAITRALVDLMSQSNCHVDSSRNETQDSKYMTRLTEFQQLVMELLSATSSEDTTTTERMSTSLAPYFESKEVAHSLLAPLQVLLQAHPLAKAPVVEAIPYWNMPHPPLDDDPWQSVTKSLQRVEQALESLYDQGIQSRPVLITMARSTEDGFTPSHLVEDLQEQVLAVLDRVFCQNGNTEDSLTTSLRITKDYGEWEGSTID